MYAVEINREKKVLPIASTSTDMYRRDGRPSQFAPPLVPSMAGGQDGQLKHDPFPQTTRTTFHLDSRDRDYDIYPSSSEFVVELPETLNNVRSAVLVTAELPISYYVFSAARGNTHLRVTLGPVTQEVTIPDGNYTTTSMAAALKTALELSFPGTTFVVGFDAATLKCVITSSAGILSIDTTAAVKRTEWGLGYYLGFARGVVTTNVTSTVTGSRVAAMNPENYLLLDIGELNGLSQSALYAAGGSGRKTFAKVPLNGESYQYNFFDKTVTYTEQRPQITRLDRLRVSVRFHDGSLVDLNGAEWSLSIEFACTLTRVL